MPNPAIRVSNVSMMHISEEEIKWNNLNFRRT